MPEDRPISSVVVGLDGSPGSRRALEVAIRLASPAGAEIVPVAAIEPPAAMYSGYVPQFPTDADLEELRAELEKDWCRPLAGSAARYRPLVRVGRAADVLNQVARDEHADLIVVGRRGRGAVTELLLGSVSHELSHRAPVPVLIVNRGHQDVP